MTRPKSEILLHNSNPCKCNLAECCAVVAVKMGVVAVAGGQRRGGGEEELERRGGAWRETGRWRGRVVALRNNSSSLSNY